MGAGHHGPAEWVSIASLEAYRAALVDFVRLIPERLSDGRPCASPECQAPIGAFVIVVVSAAATTASALLFFDRTPSTSSSRSTRGRS